MQIESWHETESARLRQLSLEYRMSSYETMCLTTLLATYFNIKDLHLEPMSACVWPVFHGKSESREMFVKVAPSENLMRTINFAKAVACPLVPLPLMKSPLKFGNRYALCTEWRNCQRVPAEKMSDKQADSFLSGIQMLSAAMQSATDVMPPDGRDDPSRQYAIVAQWAERHTTAARFLRPLLMIPEAERTYGNRHLSVIHGDMHMKNYGFNGEKLSSVFDFDTLIMGLPCEDVSYAFTERMRRSELSHTGKDRLLALFVDIVNASPWPREEWRIAVNHARLRIASRRLQKHPANPFVALDVARRDKPLRPMLEVLS